jgi:hypothetical protein
MPIDRSRFGALFSLWRMPKNIKFVENYGGENDARNQLGACCPRSSPASPGTELFWPNEP